jgi:Rrf2 family protein
MNSRFAVATHIMAYLAIAREKSKPTNSETIAKMVRTNPVVVRRLVGALREAELVKTQLGAGGGASLSRCPGQITLRDIYEAIEESAAEADLFALESIQDDVCTHRIGQSIHTTLHEMFGAAEEAMKQALGQVNLLHVLDTIHLKLGGPCPELQAVCQTMETLETASLTAP